VPKLIKKAVTNKTANGLLLDIEHPLRLVLSAVFHPIGNDIGVRSFAYAVHASFTPASTSSLNEFQEVLVDRLGVGGKHAMRETRIELQSGVLKELDLEQSSAFVRNDLVVFALHD